MSASIPRLEMQDLRPDLAEFLQPRVKRLNYLGEFFKVTGHVPDVLLPFLQFTEALKDALPNNLTEAAVFTVATWAKNDYERHQHERLALKLGFSEAWIRDAERLDPDSAGELSEAEKATQRYALACLERFGKDCGGEFAALVEAVGHEQAIAVAFLVGRYSPHAMVVNTLALAPPVPSPLTDGEKQAS